MNDKRDRQPLAFPFGERLQLWQAETAAEGSGDSYYQAIRNLRELKAYVEWRDYYSAHIPWLLQELPTLEDGQFLKDMKDWQNNEIARGFLEILAYLFSIEAPKFFDRQQWIEYASFQNPPITSDGYNDLLIALYVASQRSIIVMMPELMKTTFWFMLDTLTHEFGHHLLRMKAEQAFSALNNKSYLQLSGENYADDSIEIRDNPLLTVIICCEEDRVSDDAYEHYMTGKMSREEATELLEEYLVDDFSSTIINSLRESFALRRQDDETPTPLKYANIILAEMKDLQRNIVDLGFSCGEHLRFPQYETLSNLEQFTALEEFLVSEHIFDECYSFCALQLMKLSKDPSNGDLLRILAYEQDMEFISLMRDRLEL